MAWVEGSPSPRGEAFAEALHASLERLGARVPRGALLDDEAAQGRAWIEALAFAGRVWRGSGHAVGLGPRGASPDPPPPGRNVLVLSGAPLDATRSAPHLSFVVAVGSDRPDLLPASAFGHARLSRLGLMQRPPLDGPVDRRKTGA